MSTELETIAPPAALVPSSPEEAVALAKIGVDAEIWSATMRMAKLLAQSSLIPLSLQNKPADVFVVLMKGRALGLDPMMAIENINVIRGKAIVGAACLVGVVKKSPLCEYFRQIESTKEKATYETKRRGDSQPRRFTFTIEDAKLLGLLDRKGKDGEPNEWQKQPANMLRQRAKSWLVKDVYEDLLLGLEPDERDFADDEPLPDASWFSAEIRRATNLKELEIVGKRISMAALEHGVDELEKEYRARREELKKATAQ